MAAGYLSAPGTEYGPCVNTDECEHRDCAQTREMAAMLCQICGEPIGYVLGFYQDGTWKELDHAICAQRKHREERDHEEFIKADYVKMVRGISL